MPKILLYITTVYSEEHLQFFDCCWPPLLQKSALLKASHVIVFSNNMTLVANSVLQPIRELFQDNPSFAFKFAPESELKEIKKLTDQSNQQQMGANSAVKLGFSERWFAPFDWVVRVNPDVLIRNSTWLLKTMKDPLADLIYVKCQEWPPRIHTDFFAVRPTAISPTAFREMEYEVEWRGLLNHEITAHKEFRHLLANTDNNNGTKVRARHLPDAADSRNLCRVRGANSSVYHMHAVHGGGCSSPNTKGEKTTCRALEGFDVT